MRVGEYEIVRKIGEGAYGKVYLARRGTQGFRAWYALKRLRAEHKGDAAFEEYLLREAHLGALVQHPGLVRIHEVIRLPGEFVLVMDWVDGVSLREVVHSVRSRGEQIPAEVAIEIAASVLDALHHIHTLVDPEGEHRGFVHRDVKPGNILIGRDGNVRVMDFGVARGQHHEGATMAGELRGTLAYMAPEQARGDAATGASDQFAVGLLLLELRIGQSAWGDGRGGQILQKVVQGDVREGLARLPADDPSRDVLMRMLRADVAERFPTAAEAGRALRAVRARIPTPPMLPDWAPDVVGAVRAGRAPDESPSWTKSGSSSGRSSGSEAGEGGDWSGSWTSEGLESLARPNVQEEIGPSTSGSWGRGDRPPRGAAAGVDASVHGDEAGSGKTLPFGAMAEVLASLSVPSPLPSSPPRPTPPLEPGSSEATLLLTRRPADLSVPDSTSRPSPEARLPAPPLDPSPDPGSATLSGPVLPAPPGSLSNVEAPPRVGPQGNPASVPTPPPSQRVALDPLVTRVLASPALSLLFGVLTLCVVAGVVQLGTRLLEPRPPPPPELADPFEVHPPPSTPPLVNDPGPLATVAEPTVLESTPAEAAPTLSPAELSALPAELDSAPPRPSMPVRPAVAAMDPPPPRWAEVAAPAPTPAPRVADPRPLPGQVIGNPEPTPAPAVVAPVEARSTEPRLRLLSTRDQPLGVPLELRVRAEAFRATRIDAWYEWRSEGSASRRKRELSSASDGSFVLSIPASELGTDRLQVWFVAQPGELALGSARDPIEVRVR